jgi:hypothetical protein
MLLPRGGEYKVLEDLALKVQTTLNQWRNDYDLYILTTQFRDKLQGSVLCALVYRIPKAMEVKSTAGYKAAVQPAAQEVNTTNSSSNSNVVSQNYTVTGDPEVDPPF